MVLWLIISKIIMVFRFLRGNAIMGIEWKSKQQYVIW